MISSLLMRSFFLLYNKPAPLRCCEKGPALCLYSCMIDEFFRRQMNAVEVVQLHSLFRCDPLAVDIDVVGRTAVEDIEFLLFTVIADDRMDTAHRRIVCDKVIAAERNLTDNEDILLKIDHLAGSPADKIGRVASGNRRLVFGNDIASDLLTGLCRSLVW